MPKIGTERRNRAASPRSNSLSAMSTAPDAASPLPSYSHELRLAIQRLARRLQIERSREHSSSQLGVLIHLDLQGATTAAQLAEDQRVTPPAITRTVAELERQGLVARARSDQDGRAILITITEAGTTVVNAYRREYNEWIEARLLKLSDAENMILRAATPLLRHLADD